ncbi:type II toxin-antitoxin system RelE/ParE family toxin [Candidatus Wolfebacteria bacterium]|nr:type II toxin-antitoxin system RelE/ParE family toxin [Candidatus Wolfebacteria bacterium]
MYKIVYTKNFERNFKKIDNSIAKRILDKISELSENPYNIKLLKYSPKDLPNLCKLRCGDWRILFWVDFKIILLFFIRLSTEVRFIVI